MRLWEIRLGDQSVMLVEVEDPERNLSKEFLDLERSRRKTRYFAPTVTCCVLREAVVSVEPYDARSVKTILAQHGPPTGRKKPVGF